MNNKQQKIISMFDEIASSYDLANRVMSCGIDISWRKKACNLAFKNLPKDSLNSLNILDVACGTGDMISHWQKNANGVKIHKIIGADPSSGMLEVAQKKFPHIHFMQCEATNLPFQNKEFDILSIAYGIRNVEERKKALEEFARVLKKEEILELLKFTIEKNQEILEKFMGFNTKNI